MKERKDITWEGESIDDVEILSELPHELFNLLSEINGFILYRGAVHVRGACISPEWHSLRTAWRGPQAFHVLYEHVRPSDVPFAQDQLGDQYLLREVGVCHLAAETGEVESFCESLRIFLQRVEEGVEDFLNVGLKHTMEPGQLLLANPPFCFRESTAHASLNPLAATDVVAFHADLARQIRDIPEGGHVSLTIPSD
jgi:hypothetical protein